MLLEITTSLILVQTDICSRVDALFFSIVSFTTSNDFSLTRRSVAQCSAITVATSVQITSSGALELPAYLPRYRPSCPNLSLLDTINLVLRCRRGSLKQANHFHLLGLPSDLRNKVYTLRLSDNQVSFFYLSYAEQADSWSHWCVNGVPLMFSPHLDLLLSNSKIPQSTRKSCRAS